MVKIGEIMVLVMVLMVAANEGCDNGEGGNNNDEDRDDKVGSTDF